MAFYAIQVKTGNEEIYKKLAEELVKEKGWKLYWLRREMRIRKRGRWKKSLASLYPGYLFLHADTLDFQLIRELKKIKGFIRFLKDNQNIQPLSDKDSQIIYHFLDFGEIAKQSLVEFDEKSKVRVISGPLKGLEGIIVKINRRKGRAKIRLQIYDNVFTVDLSFETITKSKDEMIYNKPGDSEN